MSASTPLSAGSDPGIRHGTLARAERHVGAPAGVVCPARRDPVPRTLLIAAVVIAVGVLLMYAALSGSAGLKLGIVAGLLSLLAFGTVLMFILPRAFGPPVGILLVSEGVFCRMPSGTAWLPWFTIAAVELGEFRGRPWVAFRLDRDAEGAIRTGSARWLRWLNHGFRMHVGYPAQALVPPAEDAAALLRRLLGDPGLRAQLRDPSILATLRRPDATAWRRW